MLINKVQTKEDIAALREIPAIKLDEILKDTPPHVLKIIADVLFVLLLKENVPLDEAEELVEKVREKKMGELFENMEHMDIQAERRNTAEQRRRADKEKERADKAEERADKEKKQRKIERERDIRIFVDTCQEFGLSKEDVVNRLVEKYEMNRELAEEWFKKVTGGGNE